MTRPLRLQLSRAKGFDLQALSLAANGLPAVNVARPSKWGNPFTVAAAFECGYPATNGWVVERFRDWLGGIGDYWMGPKAEDARATILANITDLTGKNLACWCRPGEPCHADVLLELANAPVCEEVET